MVSLTHLDDVPGRRRLLEREILTEGLTASIASDAEHEMHTAREFAEQSPFPAPEDAFLDLYA